MTRSFLREGEERMQGAESRRRVATVALVALAGALCFAAIGLVVLNDARAAGQQQLKCGDTITTDTTLDHNLIDCPGNGIVIGADGVTLDLSHHSIVSDGVPATGCDPDTEFCDIGVLNIGHDDVTVEHGSVRRFDAGAIVGGARDNHLIDIAAVRSRFSGLVVGDAARSVVKDSSIARNGTHTDQAGMSLFNSRRISIVHNSIRDNGDIGVYDEELNRSRLVGNKISGHPEAGVLVNGNGNLIAHNRLRRNRVGVGIGGNENIVRRNVVHSNGLGLQVGGGKRNLFARNQVRDGGVGIEVASYGPVADTIVRRNHIRGAREDGLAVRSIQGKPVKRTRLRGNRVLHSGDDGIDVASASTTLTGNEANRNADLGIAAPRGVTDGGANKARSNGDSRQCTHVICK